ncbi:MAG: Ca2+/H+ antiporter, family [Actinomycetota bacterium]|nr:Ca2+/H+ antiporter, family [Actinomycetota bacterium]
MDLAVIAAVFPIIFIGELPDKSMFASLVMAARGRPFAVWLGAASAFLVHVVIAVTIGVAVFNLLPRRVLDFVIAVLFGFSSYLAFAAARPSPRVEPVEKPDSGRVFATAFGVIFLAEWGDLTQVLTANLSARYHAPLSVAVGAALALWAVAGLAVIGGHGLLSRLPTRPLRLVTGSVLAVLAVVELVAAFR